MKKQVNKNTTKLVNRKSGTYTYYTFNLPNNLAIEALAGYTAKRADVYIYTLDKIHKYRQLRDIPKKELLLKSKIENNKKGFENFVMEYMTSNNLSFIGDLKWDTTNWIY